MTPPGDPYRVLGLAPGASADDVKRAYRRLAKRYHPDSAGGAWADWFLVVQAAYEAIVRASSAGGATMRRRSSGTPGSAGAGPPAGAQAPGAGPTNAGRAGAEPRGAGSPRTGSPGTGPAARPRRPGARPGTRDEEADRAARPAAGQAGRDDGMRSGRGTRTARPGSTSYDDAEREPAEPRWQGARWYGQSSGTYWTINPREYADPRKHGPEYLARGRPAAGPHGPGPDRASVPWAGGSSARRGEAADAPPREAARAATARAGPDDATTAAGSVKADRVRHTAGGGPLPSRSLLARLAAAADLIVGRVRPGGADPGRRRSVPNRPPDGSQDAAR